MFRTESEDPVEVAQGKEAELTDGTEIWFTKDAFQFIVALQQGAGFTDKFFSMKRMLQEISSKDNFIPFNFCRI